MSGQLYMTQVTEATSKTICPKNHFAPPPTYLETPKDIATKSGQTHLWDTAVQSCKFSNRLARDICPGQKYTFFFIGDCPGGIVPCYTFLESSRRANVTPHLTCNAAT